MTNSSIHNLLTKWVTWAFLIGALILSVPSFIFADNWEIIYQKELWNGVKIVQTEDASYLKFKNKIITQKENHRYWIECSDINFSDFIGIETRSLEESKIMIETKKMFPEGVMIQKVHEVMEKKYPIEYGSMTIRACWEKYIEIKKHSKNWFSVAMPWYEGPAPLYFINLVSKSIIQPKWNLTSQSHISIGKNGLYALDDSYRNGNPQNLWLFTNKWDQVLQYTSPYPEDKVTIVRFELLYNGKIKLFFQKMEPPSWDRLSNNPEDSFTQIISITLK